MSDAIGLSPDLDQQSSNLLGSLPFILWQRRWLAIIPAVLIALAAIVAAFLWPPSYEATAVVLVESQNLPDTTAAGNSLDNLIDRRIAKFREQILARPDLVGLIQANNLYDANHRKEPLSVLVDRMQKATDISAVDTDIKTTTNQNAGSIAFQLTFDYPGAAEAQLVAQAFVDRLLKLDASQTQTEAQTNVNFLQDQQTGLQSQITAVESQINQLTGQNGMALANSGGLGMISVGSADYETQIATLRRDNAKLQAQLGGDALGTDTGVLAAQAQLAAARAQYADNHPDVKLAEARLAAAKANARTTLTSGMTAPIKQQINANNEAIAQLDSARGAALSHAAAIAAAQSRGPAIAQRVAQLAAKADQLRLESGKVSAALLSAEGVVKLADEQRGERLTLIDPPVTPDMPKSPNRPLVIIGGIVLGLAVGIGLALAVEMIKRPIRSVSALTKLVGVPPLAVIPVLSQNGPHAPRYRGNKFAALRKQGKSIFNRGKAA